MHQEGAHDEAAHVPRTTLMALEQTIQERKEAMLGHSGATQEIWAQSRSPKVPRELATRCMRPAYKARVVTEFPVWLQRAYLGWNHGASFERILLRPALPCAFPFSEGKPSWTSKLLSNPELLCKKIREEAGELCETLEKSEGSERAASEAADLLYHAMVLLNLQGVPMEDVLRVLRKRFHQSGLEEKAARAPK